MVLAVQHRCGCPVPDKPGNLSLPHREGQRDEQAPEHPSTAEAAETDEKKFIADALGRISGDNTSGGRLHFSAERMVADIEKDLGTQDPAVVGSELRRRLQRAIDDQEDGSRRPGD
jgi:hypothetical protein